MNIPQVNAGATDHNRKQMKRICGLVGWSYGWQYSLDSYFANPPEDAPLVKLPNGSFTLDQVVGMLEGEGVAWRLWHIFATQYRRVDHRTWGWGRPTPSPRDGSEVLIETDDPYDLTAAMDALIKVLETKQGETT